MKKRKVSHGSFNLLVLAVICASLGGVLLLVNEIGLSNKAFLEASIFSRFSLLSSDDNPYLTNWTQSGPGGGGFAMQIRVAPEGFFGLSNNERVYLANDMHGVFRGKSVNPKNGTVYGWKHLWNPVPGSMDEMPSKFTTSIAFVRNFKKSGTDRLVAGTRDGIFLYDEANKKWSKPEVLPGRSDLIGKGFEMDPNDGIYPWISTLKEVENKSNLILAGVGDSREAQKIGLKRYGLGAVLRSVDGGNTWDFLKITGAANDEVVFDIDYLLDKEIVHVFITTEKAVYYSKDIFESPTPNFKAISGDLPLISNSTADKFAELRSLEYLVSEKFSEETSPEIVLFAAVNSNVRLGKGVYKASLTLGGLADNSILNWQQMTADDKRFGPHLIQSLAKSKESTIEKHRIFINNHNRQYLGLLTEQSPLWYTVVSEDSASVDRGYYEKTERIALGFLEVAPRNLVAIKEPAVYGAWFFGPYFSPGHSSFATSSRSIGQLFTRSHHENNGNNFFRSIGFDEVSFTDSSAVDIKPGDPKVMIAGNPDNGILLTDDWGLTWAVVLPYTKEKWVERYGRELFTGYQFKFNPRNGKCVVGGIGPERYGDGESNVGELIANASGGYGGAENWFVLGGGPENANGLPNAEVHALVFDPRSSHSGKSGLFVGVRGHGIYYGEVTEDCRLLEGTQFIKLSQTVLKDKIPSIAGRAHYYSELGFDPGDKDSLYVARRHPAGGLFYLKLKSSFFGERAVMSEESAIENVSEIVRGAMNEKDQERCPLNESGNKYNAASVNSFTITKNHILAAVGYGAWEDKREDSGACSVKSSSDAVNYYGGIVMVSKNAVLDSTGSSPVNKYVVGGPDSVGNPPVKTFQIGGIAQNPKYKKHIVAITTGSVYPRNRKTDNILAGEEDSKISGLWVSLDEGNTFVFHSWPFPFPNATSLKFAPSGKRLIVPSRGNGFWIWKMP